MRTPPEDDDDRERLSAMNAAEWQIALLDMNPSYPHWGPHEDYMTGNGQWSSPVIFDSWGAFGPWRLDDWNECFHFYFQVDRASRNCDACDGTGMNPETRRLGEDFYALDCSRGSLERERRRWCDKITEDELDALKAHGRVPVEATLAEINAANAPARCLRRWAAGTRGLGHDAINRHILVKARAKRLDVWGDCDECRGRGYIFTAEYAHANLVLWWGHPRKGATRGIQVQITEADLPGVFRFLREAATRNAERFSKIPSGPLWL